MTHCFRADWKYKKRKRLRPKAFEAIKNPLRIDEFAIDYFYFRTKDQASYI